MHVVKKEFMYVSKPFGGEGGEGLQRVQYTTSPLHPQTKGNKIRIGCLNPAFWGAHKWAEMLRHPCFLGDPQQRGQNQSTKKNKKKQKQKTSHGVLDPAYSPANCPHWGLNLGPFRGTAFFTH